MSCGEQSKVANGIRSVASWRDGARSQTGAIRYGSGHLSRVCTRPHDGDFRSDDEADSLAFATASFLLRPFTDPTESIPWIINFFTASFRSIPHKVGTANAFEIRQRTCVVRRMRSERSASLPCAERVSEARRVALLYREVPRNERTQAMTVAILVLYFHFGWGRCLDLI